MISLSDKLQKFFKIKPTEEHENPIQFFFKEINKNAQVIRNRNIPEFYDEIFEKYMYKISKSLYNEDIIKSLITLLKIFNINKRYINLTNYQKFYEERLNENNVKDKISVRKFYENL